MTSHNQTLLAANRVGNVSNLSVLVTGGAGYVGSLVSKRLAQAGHSPIVIDNFSTGRRDLVKWGACIEADLRDQQQVRQALRAVSFDAVIHLAASVDVRESLERPEFYYENNFLASKNLFLALVQTAAANPNGARIPVVFSSSGTVYGVSKRVALTEQDPTGPISPYGESKLRVEQLLSDLARGHDLPVVIFRYFNVAGADPEGECGEWHDREAHLIPRALKAAKDQTPLYVFGSSFPTKDGTAIRDYLHVADVAEAHVLALEYLMARMAQEGQPASESPIAMTLSGSETSATALLEDQVRKTANPLVLNLGSGQGYSVTEVLDAVGDVIGKKVPRIDVESHPGDPPRLVAEASRAKQVLGWAPRLSQNLHQMVEHTWRWQKSLLET